MLVPRHKDGRHIKTMCRDPLDLGHQQKDLIRTPRKNGIKNS